MGNDKLTGLSELAEPHGEVGSASLPALGLDASKYLPEMGEFEISDAQKIELLQTLWSIMRSFVELGFDMNICEQLLHNGEEFAKESPRDVSLPNSRAMEQQLSGKDSLT